MLNRQYDCLIRHESLKELVRKLQRATGLKYCHVLERLAHASGFRDWNDMIATRYWRTCSEDWVAAVTRDIGSEVIDQFEPEYLEDVHDRTFPPANVVAEVTGAQILADAAARQVHRMPRAPVVIRKPQRRIYQLPGL